MDGVVIHSVMQKSSADALADDIAAVQRIAAIPAILDVICNATGMGFAAVARVTDEHWIACSVLDKISFGLEPGGELDLRTTICDEIRQSGEAVIIDHVSQDPHFCTHHTPAKYGFESYISIPITLKNGSFFGTLCAIDPAPAQLSRPEIRKMFELFAELIAVHLDMQDRLDMSDAANVVMKDRLTDERHTAELREQFIAVLGHDLRNPVASIDAGTRMLLNTALDTRSAAIVTMMRASVTRMTGLIDNVLDFARGRLGGGLNIAMQPTDLAPTLQHVIDELAAANPDRAIVADLKLDRPVKADPARIGQLLSNLLGNAITHGAADKPVRVEARTTDRAFELTVRNGGEPIPADAIARLFQPFSRAAAKQNTEGLGLGLYISSEIARAHGATLDVSSTPDETAFVLRLPG